MWVSLRGISIRDDSCSWHISWVLKRKPALHSITISITGKSTPDHFILADCTKDIDFGEEKKSIYALDGAEILVQREKEVQMAVNEFGAGRTVYISGLPYSFENSRILHRSILWSAHDEDKLQQWFSSNFNVEVHAFVENGKYCVVNNTYEPQSTVVYKGDGSSFALDLAANEIRWYEI